MVGFLVAVTPDANHKAGAPRHAAKRIAHSPATGCRRVGSVCRPRRPPRNAPVRARPPHKARHGRSQIKGFPSLDLQDPSLGNIGLCKFLIGSIEEAIAAQEQAIRLSPRDPMICIWYSRIGQAHLLQSRIDEAILWFEKARSANPRMPFVRAFLASAYALKGQANALPPNSPTPGG